MLTLAIRGLVTVDMPETEVQIFPVEDLLELAFAVEGSSDAPEPVTPASAKVSVIGTKRDADRLTLTLRVEPEGMDALPGMFLLCDGITVTSSASGTLYTHAYGGGQSCADAGQAIQLHHQRVDHCSIRIACCGMDNHSGRLENNGQIIVLIDN